MSFLRQGDKSFLRHAEIYRSDVGSKTSQGRGAASRWSVPGPAKGRDGRTAPYPSSTMSFRTGYSLAGCSPAEPASASPAATNMPWVLNAGNDLSANGNLSLISVSQWRGALQGTHSPHFLHARINHVVPNQYLIVRGENIEDRPVIRSINEAAFGRPDEAGLVDSLRTEGVVLASLVAEIEKRLAGHILFSRMWVETANGSVSAVALAPMAVLPEYQRRGIGECLIRHGLDLLCGRGEQIVIVLGHPDYYPRFGFSSEKARPLESPFPRDAFMALELSPGALDGIRGHVRYPAAFGL